MLQLHSRTLWNYRNVKKTDNVLNELVKMFNLKDVSEMITNKYILNVFEQILSRAKDYEFEYNIKGYDESFWEAFLTNNNHSLLMIDLLAKTYDINAMHERDIYDYYHEQKHIMSLFNYGYYGKYLNIIYILIKRNKMLKSFRRLCHEHFKYKSFYGLLYYITLDYYLYRLQQEGIIKIYYDLEHWNILTILPDYIRDIVIKHITIDDIGRNYIKYITTNNYKENIQRYVLSYGNRMKKHLIYDPSDEYTDMFCKFCQHWIINGKELRLNDNLAHYIYRQPFIKFFIEYVDFIGYCAFPMVSEFINKYKYILFAKKKYIVLIISATMHNNVKVFEQLKALYCMHLYIMF